MTDLPGFDPEASPRGVFCGEYCLLIYDIRPVPEHPGSWTEALENQLRVELSDVAEQPPTATVRLERDGDAGTSIIRCTVTNPGPPPLLPLLAEIDEAVERALSMTNALYEAGQGTLAERLVQLRRGKPRGGPVGNHVEVEQIFAGQRQD